MKKIYLSMMSSAVLLLSGCSSMVYGNRVAPVTSLNQNVAPSVPQSTIRRVPLNPGQVAAVSPNRGVIAQPPAQSLRPIRPQVIPDDGVRVIAQSPYGSPAVASPYQPAPNTNDGWGATPQLAQNNALPASNPAPQVDVAVPVAQDEPKPMRPNSQQDNTTANTTTGTSDNGSQSVNTSQDQVATVAPTPARQAREETAVSTLLQKASSSLSKGDLDGAAAYLENAQRIDPQNAKILYDIANIRYHQGRYKDAENFAGRATSKNGSNDMMRKSWALIANARKQLGDNQGAIVAAERAASYGN